MHLLCRECTVEACFAASGTTDGVYVACLSHVQPALFVHLRGAGTWWVNTTLSCSTQLQAAYWAVGWLLGQALVNHCTVGLQLAPLLFHRLLQQPHDQFKVRG
jgi:hypothetical protein